MLCKMNARTVSLLLFAAAIARAHPRYGINADYKSAQQWPAPVIQIPTLPYFFGNRVAGLPGFGSQWSPSFSPYNTNNGNRGISGSPMQQLPSLPDSRSNSQQGPLRPRWRLFLPFGDNGDSPQGSQQIRWPWKRAPGSESDSQILPGFRSPPRLFPTNINENMEASQVRFSWTPPPNSQGNDGRKQDGIPGLLSPPRFQSG